MDLEEDFQVMSAISMNCGQGGSLSKERISLSLLYSRPIVKKFKERFPKIKLNLVEGNTPRY